MSFGDLEEWSAEHETMEESWQSRKFVEIRVDPTTHVAFLVLQGMGPDYDVMVGCVWSGPASASAPLLSKVTARALRRNRFTAWAEWRKVLVAEHATVKFCG